jgi:hypothetical protein
MDRDALIRRVESLGDDGDNDLKLMLLFLATLIDKRDRTRMHEFAVSGYDRIKQGKQLPNEWVEFAFERLAEAAQIAYNEENPKLRSDKAASAIYMSGRKDKDIEHAKVVEMLLIIQYETRHKKGKDSLGEAIDIFIEFYPTIGKKSSLKLWYKQHSDELLQYICEHGTFMHRMNPDFNDMTIRQWAERELKRRFPPLNDELVKRLENWGAWKREEAKNKYEGDISLEEAFEQENDTNLEGAIRRAMEK